MAKASVLFPCMMVLCLVIFATGIVDGCNYPCHGPNACGNLHCDLKGCVKKCVNSCCLCDCSGNEKPQINM
ncbi:hypothetical protein LR48_Vigan09g124000 [Vigna angularis]|uniref:Uncharacterized protein n=1 Tax=Phaseolus angularis TaxID=3914 RepID=A0A0L9VBZ1_PHAAN|nr:hypothetical protein LR48_Vigan09g124000 [Vigna angularis]